MAPKKKKKEPLTGLEAEVASTPYPDLCSRRDVIRARLDEIEVELPSSKKKKGGAKKARMAAAARAAAAAAAAQKAKERGKEPPPPPTPVPLLPRNDVHWDYVMKEMMWLGADFQSERKSHLSAARKVAGAVRQFHKTKESRRLRELAEFELRRRRLAGRMAREVKGWWGKIERVISYKQKIDADEVRRRAMDKHLVFLVRQTERYGRSLARQQRGEGVDDDDDSGRADEDGTDAGSDAADEDRDAVMDLTSESDGEGIGSRRRHCGRGRKRGMTIEEALSAARTSSRQSRKLTMDYTRLRVDPDDDELYGESTADDSDEYEPNETDGEPDDDEQTLIEAEREGPGPREREEEVRKLREEGNMDVERVIERLAEEARDDRAEGGGYEAAAAGGPNGFGADGEGKRAAKKVSFAPNPPAPEKVVGGTDRASAHGGASAITLRLRRPREDGGSDADDDADASDVEDFIHGGEADDVDNGDDGSGEFKADENVIDDETALEAEERLGQEMNPEEEIALLQREGEMSIEELRTTYVPKEEEGGVEEEEEAGGGNSMDVENADGAEGNEGDSSGSEEFEASELAIDDETTIEAEEKLGRDMSYKEEIDILQRENEMSVEELRAMYARMEDGNVESDDQDEVSSHMAQCVEGYEGASADDAGVGTADSAASQHVEAEKGEDAPDEVVRSETDRSPVGEPAPPHTSEIAAADNEEAKNSLEIKANGEGTTLKGDESYEYLSLGVDDELADDEFQPDTADGFDDETTLEVEERLGRDMSYEDEILLLKRESEMSVEELRAKYAAMDEAEDEPSDPERDGSDAIVNESADSEEGALGGGGDGGGALCALAGAFDEDDQAEEDEFRPSRETEIDDEMTLEEEEKLGREMSHEEEIALLQREGETPIEELRAMYERMEAADAADGMGEGAASGSSDGEQRLAKRKRDGGESANGGDVAENVPKKSKSNPSTDEDKASVLQKLQASENRVRSTMVSRPFLLSSWVNLRQYQEIGLNWLVSIQTRRLNGILADEMGLGKTLQTISLLSYLSCYKGIWGPHLIIVPTSCIVNWEMELKRFCPALKVLCYYGTAKRRKELRVGWTKSNWYHVVVTSYQLAVQDAFAFKRKRWYYLILDEAQNIKNFQSQRWQTLVNFNTQRRLLLTGTPLQNNLMELWSLLHFLMPHVFRSRKEFSYWFSNPMNSIIEGNASRNDDLIGRLHSIIRPFVLRRLKKDVEAQMPGKYEHIVQCQMSRRQMFLYEEFMARSSTRMAFQKGGNYMGMMNVLMQLRKVCNHPDLFEPRTVITPFFMDPLNISTAACVVGAAESDIERLSSYLLHPLWSGPCGMPSFDVVTSHDAIRASQLAQLETPSQVISGKIAEKDITEPRPIKSTPFGIATLLNEIWTASKREKVSAAQLQANVNSLRCRSTPFFYSERTVNAVHVGPMLPNEGSLDDLSYARIASTPTELLAMKRSQQERADDLDDLTKKFVFCVPKAGARKPELRVSKVDLVSISNEAQMTSALMKPLETTFRPFRKAEARLTSFFPDKKLVQFDAGKLQALAVLLRDLKRDGHRALIFTQMSKMLDILEAFLNLNGHTYLRLDGGTGVEKRQRLMDRFNNDTRVFCFILSTRSGGLGINLTGADTVIFYDSDWNPAMDAQAQDRAHRIGQTRDVHIYRLVTEHSIEENILIKAKQKRHLDFLVMDEGKFNATASTQNDSVEEKEETKEPDVLTKGGLRDILGLKEESKSDSRTPQENGKPDNEENLSKEQIENAMASLEDEDDVMAMRGAQKEAAEELQEFDESVQLKENEGEGGDSQDEEGGEDKKCGSSKKGSKKKEIAAKKEERVPSTEGVDDAMEKEFAAWQTKVGVDTDAINASLTPTERYALNFREEIDPFESVHFFSEEQKMEEAASLEGEWNVEEIELAKVEEEKRAIEDGDLLATQPPPESLPRQRQLYAREKARLRADKLRRKLTGKDWEPRVDGLSDLPFWFNTDTGEARWDKPNVLLRLEADALAHEKKWNAMPTKPLVYVMEYLVPYPERMCCAGVCQQWRIAATDISFVKHVFPVEYGALALDPDKLEHNHYRTIAEALESALPGDTIELGDGHYWVNEPGLRVKTPLRIIGDENDPSHVVIELSGSIEFCGVSGWMEGVTLRRPRISSDVQQTCECLRVGDGGKFDMAYCVLDNEGNIGNVSLISGASKGCWEGVVVRGSSQAGSGISIEDQSQAELLQCRIINNHGDGVRCRNKSTVKIRDCHIGDNFGFGVSLSDMSRCDIEGTYLASNGMGDKSQDARSSFGPCDQSSLKRPV